ncbi:MAG: kynureninase [Ignavibacteriae bacterium]|nr:kynureninase [Ignavibacteriota bacterium]
MHIPIEELDARDPLAAFRARFAFPTLDDGSLAVYLCGNSLGLQPLSVRRFIDRELDDWARHGVEGHFRAHTPWVSYHESLTTSTALLVGALPSEVVVMNSLTVNLHLLLVSFYRPTPARHKIAIEHMAFPSDRYAAASQLAFHGFDPQNGLIEIAAHDGGDIIPTSDILELIERRGDEIALLLLGGVNYYSGQFFELGLIAEAARAKGITVGFDLAHAVGNVPLALHEWGPDFAVWCSYKYLNAGPGAPGGAFVHQRHGTAADLPRFAGWWGHDKATRFAMGPDFHPIPGAEGWQLSNAPVLGMAALRASMQIFDEAGIDALRVKSAALTGALDTLLRSRPHADWDIITPADPLQRGAQLSIRVRRNGREVFNALAAQGVICDWREPDVIRVAPAPLYNSFYDVLRFAGLFHAEFHAKP